MGSPLEGGGIIARSRHEEERLRRIKVRVMRESGQCLAGPLAPWIGHTGPRYRLRL